MSGSNSKVSCIADSASGARLAAAVSRVLLSPGRHPRHGFRSAVIVGVLGEPFGLAGPLARRLTRRRPAITLMPRVTPVRHKRLTAIHAGVLPALCPSRLPSCLITGRATTRSGKKTKEDPSSEEKPALDQALEEHQETQENPVSRPPVATSFRLAATACFQVLISTGATGCTKSLPGRAGTRRMPWREEHRKAVCGKTACTV
jgi:hypothetical protein